MFFRSAEHSDVDKVVNRRIGVSFPDPFAFSFCELVLSVTLNFLSGISAVAKIFINVDLPAPFGPSNPNIPGEISSETPHNARTPPE
jgi:hypothetical protein